MFLVERVHRYAKSEDAARWSKSPSSEAAASEETRRTFVRYGEPLSDARTKLAGFLTILLLVEQFLEFLAGLEERNFLGGHRHGGAGLRIAPFLHPP